MGIHQIGPDGAVEHTGIGDGSGLICGVGRLEVLRRGLLGPQQGHQLRVVRFADKPPVAPQPILPHVLGGAELDGPNRGRDNFVHLRLHLLDFPVQLRLLGADRRLRLGQLVRRLVFQLLIVGRPLVHKLLHRLVEQEVQPAGENRQVHPVQQNLLPVNIQGNIHSLHLPYNTKMMRMTTSRA